MTKIHDLCLPKPDSRVLRSSSTSAQYVQLEARLAHFILQTCLRFVPSISTPTVNVSTTHFLAGLNSSNLFFTPQLSRIFSEC